MISAVSMFLIPTPPPTPCSRPHQHSSTPTIPLLPPQQRRCEADASPPPQHQQGCGTPSTAVVVLPPCHRCHHPPPPTCQHHLNTATPTTPRHTHRCRDRRPLSPPPPIHKHPDNAATRCRRHPPSPTTMHTRRKRRDTADAQDRRVSTRSPTRKRRNGRRREMDGSGDHNGRWRGDRDGWRRRDWTAADERRHEMNGGGAMDSSVINGQR